MKAALPRQRPALNCCRWVRCACLLLCSPCPSSPCQCHLLVGVPHPCCDVPSPSLVHCLPCCPLALQNMVTPERLQQMWADYFVVTFVRDPFQRAVSSYRMMARQLAPRRAATRGTPSAQTPPALRTRAWPMPLPDVRRCWPVLPACMGSHITHQTAPAASPRCYCMSIQPSAQHINCPPAALVQEGAPVCV